MIATIIVVIFPEPWAWLSPQALHRSASLLVFAEGLYQLGFATFAGSCRVSLYGR